MTFCNTVILILMHFFAFLYFKVYYFAHTASAASNVKPDVSQSINNLMLSNQTSRYIRKCIRISDHSFSALQCYGLYCCSRSRIVSLYLRLVLRTLQALNLILSEEICFGRPAILLEIIFKSLHYYASFKCKQPDRIAQFVGSLTQEPVITG